MARAEHTYVIPANAQMLPQCAKIAARYRYTDAQIRAGKPWFYAGCTFGGVPVQVEDEPRFFWYADLEKWLYNDPREYVGLQPTRSGMAKAVYYLDVNDTQGNLKDPYSWLPSAFATLAEAVQAYQREPERFGLHGSLPPMLFPAWTSTSPIPSETRWGAYMFPWDYLFELQFPGVVSLGG